MPDTPRPAPGQPAGLISPDGLAETESLMAELVGGSRPSLLGDICAEHLHGGGKRVRARLALAAAESLGVARDDVIGWAAACELLHNATLVHDDIQDGDRTRRDRPTTWAQFGVAQAINAGDLMLMLPFLAIGHVRTHDMHRWSLSRILASAAERTVRGQAAELAMLGQSHFTWAAWEAAAEGKTGALIGLPVEGAAIVGGLDVGTAVRFGEAFARLGVLFQLQDDLLDLTDRKGRGLRGSDIYEGKVSALVVEHLRIHPRDTAWLVALLRAPREATPPEQVELALGRFADGGAVASVRSRLDALAEDVYTSPLLGSVPDLGAVACELIRLIHHSADRSAAEMSRSQA